jgi:hypothetical protein
MFTMDSLIQPDLAFFLMYIEGLVMSLLVYLIVIYTRDILYAKTVKVKEVISTKLEIQTSAFKDLDI